MQSGTARIRVVGRRFRAQGFELMLAAGALLLAGFAPDQPLLTQQLLLETVFLTVLVIFLGLFIVRLRRGYLRLSLTGTQAAAMLLPPRLALVVGVISVATWIGRPGVRRFKQTGAPIFWITAGSAISWSMRLRGGVLADVSPVAVVASVTLMNWVLTSISAELAYSEKALTVFRVSFDRSFVGAFAYFALGAILIANLVDGSVRGYVLASIFAILSVVLTETIRERNARIALEAQIADTQRHLAYTRAAEGMIHNLRNHLAVAKAYLEDLLAQASPPAAQADGAKGAVDDALHSLGRLSFGASPRLALAEDPVDLRAVAEASINGVRSRMRDRDCSIETKAGLEPIPVHADQTLIREVITNLLLNAVEAAPTAGRVTVTVFKTKRLAQVRVADDGPGIAEDLRDRLFEPHFTTKPAGSGLGLFTSYGIIREHRGKLIYEGSPPKGAVFTVQLPLAGTKASRELLAASAVADEAVAEPVHSLDPAGLPDRLPKAVDRLIN